MKRTYISVFCFIILSFISGCRTILICLFIEFHTVKMPGQQSWWHFLHRFVTNLSRQLLSKKVTY